MSASVGPVTSGTAGQSASAGPAPGTPGYNPAWYALTDIYWDPSNVSGTASDANSGATALLPVLTFAELVRRWGSRTPQLKAGQTTLHMLSTQNGFAATADPGGSFKPNASMGMWAMIGTPSAISAPFSSLDVEQISRGSPGSSFTVATMPAASAAGDLIYNVTQASWCVVKSKSGSTATCSSPQAAAALTTPANDPASPTPDGSAWSTSDTLQVYRNPTFYVDEYAPSAGTLATFGGGGTEGTSWTQNVNFGDPSGAGKSGCRLAPVGLATFSLCTSAATIVLDGPPSTNSAPSGGGPCMSLYGCGFISPWLLQLGGTLDCWGCVLGGPGGIVEFGGGCFVVLKNDTIVDIASGSTVIGTLSAYNAQLAGAGTMIVAGFLYLRTPTAGNGVLWGAGTLQVLTKCLNRTGSTYTLQVLLAALKLTNAGLTTGSVFNVSAGVGTFGTGVSITSANIDTGGTGGAGIQDVPTGAAFA